MAVLLHHGNLPAPLYSSRLAGWDSRLACSLLSRLVYARSFTQFQAGVMLSHSFRQGVLWCI